MHSSSNEADYKRINSNEANELNSKNKKCRIEIVDQSRAAIRVRSRLESDRELNERLELE